MTPFRLLYRGKRFGRACSLHLQVGLVYIGTSVTRFLEYPEGVGSKFLRDLGEVYQFTWPHFQKTEIFNLVIYCVLWTVYLYVTFSFILILVVDGTVE
jgi:hypothetical protein